MNSATNLSKIVQIRAESPYFLFATLQDGQEIKFDLTPLIESREVFWRLKNFRYFRNVAIDPLGGIYWEEGEDISPTKIFCYETV
jgi:hypothetical protein